MNSVLSCAGDLTVSIDAKLLGSVRSLYEGDRTEGTAHLKSETSFLSKIPEADRLRALKLYHDCIKTILATQQNQITERVLSFRLWLNIPGDMQYWMDKNGIKENLLLQPGHFFDELLKEVWLSYRVMTGSCNWTTFQEFSNNQDYYFRNTIYIELFPDNISVSKRVWAERFSLGSYFVGASDIKSGFSAHIPDPSKPLQSVDTLVGKCLYVDLMDRRKDEQKISRPEVRELVSRFGGDTMRAAKLTHFKVSLNGLLGLELKNGDGRKVFNAGGRTVWQIELPKNIDGFRLI